VPWARGAGLPSGRRGRGRLLLRRLATCAGRGLRLRRPGPRHRPCPEAREAAFGGKSGRAGAPEARHRPAVRGGGAPGRGPPGFPASAVGRRPAVPSGGPGPGSGHGAPPHRQGGAGRPGRSRSSLLRRRPGPGDRPPPGLRRPREPGERQRRSPDQRSFRLHPGATPSLLRHRLQAAAVVAPLLPWRGQGGLAAGRTVRTAEVVAGVLLADRLEIRPSPARAGPARVLRRAGRRRHPGGPRLAGSRRAGPGVQGRLRGVQDPGGEKTWVRSTSCASFRWIWCPSRPGPW
jgi:hypothetical protein